jgi:hypothetical protein
LTQEGQKCLIFQWGLTDTLSAIPAGALFSPSNLLGNYAQRPWMAIALSKELHGAACRHRNQTIDELANISGRYATDVAWIEDAEAVSLDADTDITLPDRSLRATYALAHAGSAYRCSLTGQSFAV